MGIDRIKKLVKVSICLEKIIVDIIRHGRFDLGIFFKLSSIFKDVISVGRDFKQIILEIQDIDEPEKEIISAYIKEEFDIDDDVLEKRIEDALDFILTILVLLENSSQKEVHLKLNY